MVGQRLFDTHAHYDHPLFKKDGPGIVMQLFTEGVVNGIVIPAISYESNFNRDLFPADVFPKVYFAAGLHPKRATNEAYWSEEKMEEFITLLHDPRTVAVKTGLDFSNKKLTDTQKERQIVFFRQLIALAKAENLPLVLHIRDAVDEAAAVLAQEQLTVEAVAHCATFNTEDAQKLMDAGVSRFGIGGMLTRDGMESLRECVKNLPLSAIVLETDAPFVKPKGYKESLNTSVTMLRVAELIAELKEIPITTVISAVSDNAFELYNLK